MQSLLLIYYHDEVNSTYSHCLPPQILTARQFAVLLRIVLTTGTAALNTGLLDGRLISGVANMYEHRHRCCDHHNWGKLIAGVGIEGC